MTLLMSSTWPYQQRCQALPRSEATCHASAPTCEKHTGEMGEVAPPGPGIKGILQRATSAIARGHTGELLDSYFENNPEAVKNITSKALEGLAALFRPAPA